MKLGSILTILGLFVVVVMLTSAGIFQGQMCLRNVGCVGAGDNGLTLNNPDAKRTP